MTSTSRYPVRERIADPLVAAIELLDSLASTAPDAARVASVVAAARGALPQLDELVTPAQELLDDFVSGWGAVEHVLGKATKDAWRENEGHEDQLTLDCLKDFAATLREFLEAISGDADGSQAHVDAFMVEHAAALKVLFDEAQKDGWKRGECRSDETDDAAAVIFAAIRVTAARVLPGLA